MIRIAAFVFSLLCLIPLGCDSASSRSVSSGDAKPSVDIDGDSSLSESSVSRVQTTAHFDDRTAKVGVDFVYRNGEEAGHCAILESLGGGVAVFDADGDGDMDLFIPGGGEYGPNKEIRGRKPVFYFGDGRGNFTDATKEAGFDRAPYYSHGATVADYDNDGDADLLVTGYGGLVLYQNQGRGTFADVTESAGLTDDRWSSSAAFGDINGDGWPDLYVAHYVDWSWENNPDCPGPKSGQCEYCPPKKFAGLDDVIYFNNGNGTFRDASEEAGLSPGGKGLGVLMADVDLDGDLDIYVANDTVANFLYQNDGTGRLTEAALISGTALGDRGTADGSMGVDLGDYNGDGLPDIWVANYESESFSLYRNEGRVLFQHVSQAVGITAVGSQYVGWGTVFIDFDNDGDQDIFVSNGHVIRFPANAPVKQLPLLYENVDGRRMINVAAGAGDYLAQAHMGRGVGAGDLDNDGDVDLVISRNNQPVAVLFNESRTDHHWIALKLEGTDSGKDAVGAIVTVESALGTQTKQKKGGSSYASHNDPRIFFGLADETAVTNVQIRWPSGRTSTLTDVAVDQVVSVVEPME